MSATAKHLPCGKFRFVSPVNLADQVVAVDRELLLQFFLAFARIEYALKVSGFAKARGNNHRRQLPPCHQAPRIEPDWRSFADSIRETFNPTATKELADACAYLRTEPPHLQVILNNAVLWQAPDVNAEESELDFVLRMVRTIRNNLFHGSKYDIPDVVDVRRSERLLRCGLVILGAFLDLAPRQRDAYLNATL